MYLAKIGEDIYRALQVPAGELPRVSTWSELSAYSSKHVIVDVNIVAKSRVPLRITLHKVKCSKCGWEGTITSSDKLWCRFCKGILHVQDTVTVELNVGKVMVSEKSNRSARELNAVFIGDAKDVSPGRRSVVAYLAWTPRRSGVEEAVLIVIREVAQIREEKVDIASIIERISDWQERLVLLVDIVSQTFNISGLRPHILLLLAQLVSAHGVSPFVEGEEPRQRWWLHGAIVGDPGTGKSTLSEVVRSLAPYGKCILLSAPAVTLPGLTVGQALGYPCDGALLVLDGSHQDFGILIIEESHEIKLDILHNIKDALERGEFYRAVVGQPMMGGTCRVSLLLVANYVGGVFKGPDSLPAWLRDPAFFDRLDFVLFTFEPTDEMAREITRSMFRKLRSPVTPTDISRYIEKCRLYSPAVINPDEVAEKIYENAKMLHAAYQDVGIYRSLMRLTLSIARVSIALAKLALTNVTPSIVDYATDLVETQISSLIEATRSYIQGHAIPVSEYLIRKVLLDILKLKGGQATREELISEVCNFLEKQFYKCSEDKVDRVIMKLKHEGTIYEPELGKVKVVGL